jgi:hypothetical protein
MALSTAFSAVGAMSQAEAQRDALNYQSQVARNNATLAQYQAKDAVERGQAEEQNRRLRTAATFSDQRAQLAANGIDLGEGIATDLLATTKYIGEHDALTARNNAAREAWGYRAKARGFLDESAMKDATAGGINPLMAGATSLLGSAKSYGTDWFSPSAKVNPGNYQVGTRGYSGNYLEWDA